MTNKITIKLKAALLLGVIWAAQIGLLYGQNLLLNENFSTATGTTPPAGWTNNMITGTFPVDAWDFSNAVGYTFPAPLSGKAALFDSYNKGLNGLGGNNGVPENAALESPSISTVGLANLFLQFDHFLLRLANATARVEVSTNGGSSWTGVYTSTALMAASQTDLVNLSAYVGNASFKVRFRWDQPFTTTGGVNGTWTIDNILLFERKTNDVSVTSVTVPQGGECASATQAVRAVVTNTGTSTQTNIPVTIQVSGSVNTTFNDVIASLAPQATATVFASASINTSVGGSYTFKAFTGMATDDVRLNDTLTAVRVTAPAPANPAALSPQTVCSGPATVRVSANPGDSTYWFDDSLSTAVIGKDTMFNATLYSSRSYFAQNSRLSPGTLTTTFLGPYRVNTTNAKGVFGNLTVTNELILDSFDVSVVYSGAIYKVEVYYRPGTYVGFVNSTAGWTYLGADTISTMSLPNPLGTPLTVVVNQARLTPGTYGICFKISTISGSGNGLNPNFGWKQAVLTYTNADMSYAGSFGSYYSDPLATAAAQTGANCTGDFNFYYRKLCSSQRKRIDVIVNPRPVTSVIQGPVFNGLWRTGSLSVPDAAYEQQSVSYELLPPAGTTNSDYATKWSITAMNFVTVNGTAVPPAHIVTTLPNASNNARMTYSPPNAYVDSTIQVTISVKDLINGCDTTIIRYIYVAPRPDADFGTGLLCEDVTANFYDSTTIAKGFIASYSWDFGDPSTTADVSTQQNPSYIYATPGNYTVRLIVTSDLGFKDTVITNISVGFTPDASFIAKSGCHGDSISFNNTSTIGGSLTALTHQWDLGNGQTSTNASFKYKYANTGVYDIRLVVTSALGCRDTLVKPLTVFPKPVAAFTSGNTCQGTASAFTNNSTISSGAIGYNWNFGDGNSSNDQSPNHIYEDTGSFTVKLRVYSIAGCIDSISKSVRVFTTPVTDFNTGLACLNDSVTFTNTTQYVGSGLVTNWNFGDGITLVNGNSTLKHKYLAPGAYNVVLTSTAGTCSDSKTFQLVVTENPNTLFSTSSNVCLGKSAVFTNLTTGPSGSNITYLWSFGNSVVSTAKDTTITYASAGSYNVWLRAMVNGCMDSVQQVVVVNPLPTVSFTVTPLSGLRQVQFTPSNVNFSDYEWNMGDGVILNQVSPAYSFLTNGPFNVVLTVRNDKGCENSSTKPVSFNVSAGTVTAGNYNFDVYPNPFKSNTNVHYELRNAAKVKVSVYDLVGHEITVLENSVKEAGKHVLDFNTSALNTKAGIYLIKLEVDGVSSTRQVIEVR